ncbi:hypothetical protein [Streptomyces sp. NPDC056165]|uniref:hypothetical protein n=1 Tax=Streptomyces sp. NPDC056165 TaxID=3345733 RepID=UPI0035E2C503
MRTFDYDESRAQIEPVPPATLGHSLFGLFSSGITEEEQIAVAVRPVGQMVAVGIPDEDFPHVGAVRLYLEGEWKQPVAELVNHARLVVILLGTGSGTVWEVIQAVCTLPPERLILLIPDGLTSKEYEQIRTRVSRGLRRRARANRNRTWPLGSRPSLPPCPLASVEVPEIGFIRFSADWEPQATRALYGINTPTHNFLSTLLSEITPLFIELEKYEKRVGRTWG